MNVTSRDIKSQKNKKNINYNGSIKFFIGIIFQKRMEQGKNVNKNFLGQYLL